MELPHDGGKQKMTSWDMNLSLETAVPVLSKRNVKKIVETIHSIKPSLLVEFGSGASTLYFIKVLNELSGSRFVSIENTPEWFEIIAGQLSKSFGVVIARSKWKNERYNKFYSGGGIPYTNIVDGASRYTRWKRIIMAGPFWRFVPSSGSRLSLNNAVAFLLMPVVNFLTHAFRLFGLFRHYDAVLETVCGNVKFNYLLLSPGIKDQFGESPFMKEHANAWKPYVEDSENILFLIDGGPRHYIVDQIDMFHKEHPEMRITIALFDAHRPEYDEVLRRFSNASFYKGSLELIDETKFYEESPEKELWLAHLTPKGDQ